MLVGKTYNQFCIVEEVSNPPLDTPGPFLPEICIKAEKDGQEYGFIFLTEPNILPYQMQLNVLEEVLQKQPSSQRDVFESYVCKAFDRVTSTLTDEQREAALSEEGCKVSFMSELVPLPVTDLP